MTGEVPDALCICCQVPPFYLQSLVRQFVVSWWLTNGASKLEQLKTTVPQPSREWREREGADFLPHTKGNKKFPVSKTTYFSRQLCGA